MRRPLREPSIVSKSQIAERFGVSRARVCQVLNLLELDYNIQKYLLSIDDVKEYNFYTERRLRQIATIKDKAGQTAEFNRLKRKIVCEAVLTQNF